MAHLSTNELKRDFIAKEVRKRIIGPGYAEDVYKCLGDATDEILSERPEQVYTSGILFPVAANKENSDAQSSSQPSQTQNATGTASAEYDLDEDAFGNDSDMYGNSIIDPLIDEDIESSQSGYAQDGEQNNYINEVDEDNVDDSFTEEKAGNKPDRIGLITCIKADTSEVDVTITYGKYHHLREEEWSNNVKVILDERCPVQVLKDRFAYYDEEAKDILYELGVSSMDDLFTINDSERTVSPRRLLKVIKHIAEDNTKDKYYKASDFPKLKRNIASDILAKVLKGEKVKLDNITWEDFIDYVKLFDTIKEISDIITKISWGSLEEQIQYDASSKIVSSKKKLPVEYGNLKSHTHEYDPVREYVLDRLLEYNFFKRNHITEAFKLDLESEASVKEINDDVKVFWKTFVSKGGQRYLRVLMQNATKNVPQGENANIFQAQLCVSSPDLTPYSEPQTSTIDDEFNINENLYSEEKFYGKGVNCAVEWESGECAPTWVKTTYSPSVNVRSFDQKTNDSKIREACTVHNISLWGKSDMDVIALLENFVLSYEQWATRQKTLGCGDPMLNGILQAQDNLKARLAENIQYLKNNPRAFWCFRLANSAMYIQMLLGRDPAFKKGRDKSEFNKTDSFFNTGCWDEFVKGNYTLKPEYYPFQLAFMLMNVKSTFESGDSYRNDSVDLIWFPTGGGKTEAYLALTALTIAERRTRTSTLNTDGVAVIMRYTLRLLTAQQFERASFLICALEYLRNTLSSKSMPFSNYNLGSEISLGMWIGKASSPNKISELGSGKYKDFLNDIAGKPNPFPIVTCPWCGCNLSDGKSDGYARPSGRTATSRKKDFCINEGCHFNYRTGLPIYYIDEQLYKNPPTLLFATVDKFAQLSVNPENAKKLLGQNNAKPDLIIQDELHLISGPLGSLVGLYESFVEELCTEKDASGNIVRTPKIIASTATTRNTSFLIKQLYGREVVSFPASGVRYSDNFFSHVLPESKRLYMGLIHTGKSASELEIKTIAAELVAKEKLITEWFLNLKNPINKTNIFNAITQNEQLSQELDNYWTQLLYYNNLKTLGRTHSKIGQEINSNVETMRKFAKTFHVFDFILNSFYLRSTEFTSRQNSTEIKRLLVEAEQPTRIIDDGKLRVESQMDIVQATNMISVGIDIDRWNVMMMVGQPLTTAEYIQASSRVGRSNGAKALVISLLNPLRSREMSYFENYTAYHQVFYKFVEPLSATTFTEMTLEKLTLNLYIGYMACIMGKDSSNQVTNSDVTQFIEWIKRRAHKCNAHAAFIGMIDPIIKLIDVKLRPNSIEFKKTRDIIFADYGLADPMPTLREVEPNTYLKYE